MGLKKAYKAQLFIWRLTENSPGCHQIPGQTEAIVVTSIDIFDQFVNFPIIALGGQLYCLFECRASSEEAAKTQECSSAQTVEKY